MPLAMASDRACYVGEIVAACIAPTRAEAEDLVETLAPDFEMLPVIASMDDALSKNAPRLFDEWDSNVSMETGFDSGIEEIIANAPVKVTACIQMSGSRVHPSGRSASANH